MRVLVAEDNEMARDLLMRYLRLAGHEFVLFADGNDAWEFLDVVGGDRFNVIISDHEMPEMSGIELLRRVRADTRTANIPFFLTSGAMAVSEMDQRGLEEVCIGLGATFVLKPYNCEELVAQIAG